jgi:hypothetical protein
MVRGAGGRGFVQLPERTSAEDDDGMYCVSVFHQIHCLVSVSADSLVVGLSVSYHVGKGHPRC